jgi:hypothetical protein
MDADYANRLILARIRITHFWAHPQVVRFIVDINIMVNNKAVFFITSDFQNDR